jgi:branched-chain amino acid aminotransferase
MKTSAEIMAMPPYPEADFLACIKELVRISSKLVPDEPGSLYLRPTMIGTSPTLGVSPSAEYSFYVLASPVGGYFGDVSSGKPSGISLWVTDEHVRAVRGGVGAAKTGANYAASLRAVQESKKHGFQNVLFLDAIERRYVEELSGMNFFVVENGTLKTPPTGDTILKGVTRDTILQLAPALKISAQEQPLDINTVIDGVKSGKISEAFACGTGACITAITELGWKGARLRVGSGEPGEITTVLYRALLDMLYGRKSPLKAEWAVKC